MSEIGKKDVLSRMAEWRKVATLSNHARAFIYCGTSNSPPGDEDQVAVIESINYTGPFIYTRAGLDEVIGLGKFSEHDQKILKQAIDTAPALAQ